MLPKFSKLKKKLKIKHKFQASQRSTKIGATMGRRRESFSGQGGVPVSIQFWFFYTAPNPARHQRRFQADSGSQLRPNNGLNKLYGYGPALVAHSGRQWLECLAQQSLKRIIRQKAGTGWRFRADNGSWFRACFGVWFQAKCGFQRRPDDGPVVFAGIGTASTVFYEPRGVCSTQPFQLF